MTDPEMILRLCAEAAPAPWYPKNYAQAAGIDRDSLDAPLERLRMAGLIRLTDWVQGPGQGYTLTLEGDDLLHNTRALAQMRTGRLPSPAAERSRPSEPASAGLTPYQRGETIRAALVYTSMPVVTLVILVANILVFLYGLALAVQANVPVNQYLSMTSHPGILHAIGSVSSQDIVEGAWWRLLTCCFVHVGLLHLGVNMYTLYAVGPLVEQMWGRGRFLALYLIAGLGGSCAQLMFKAFQSNGSPAALAGASGALWGIMASMAVWIILNRSFLPGPLTATWLRQLGKVFIINTAISMLPGIGAAAHFGGGVVGAVAGVLLNEQRFSRGVRRQLALAGLFALPLLCLGALEHARATDSQWQTFIRGRERGPAWQQAQPQGEFRNNALRDEPPRRGQARSEELLQHERLLQSVRELNAHSLAAQKAEVEALGVYDQVRPLLGHDPLQRPARAVEPMLPALEQAQARLTAAAAGLRKAGPYEHEALEKRRQLRAEHLEARAKLLRLALRSLQREGQWTPAEQMELDVQDRLVQQLDTEWRRLIAQTNAQGRRLPVR